MASSSGLSLFHIPSLPRKVGMPDSADIPAPVKKTIFFDSESLFRNVSIESHGNAVIKMCLKIPSPWLGEGNSEFVIRF